MRCWGKLKSSKCWWGQCALVVRAIFRICGNKSQPALQLVEKLVTLPAGGIRRARVWSGMLRVPRWREHTLAYS